MLIEKRGGHPGAVCNVRREEGRNGGAPGPKGSAQSEPGKETEKELQEGRMRAGEKKASLGNGVVSETAVGRDAIRFITRLHAGREEQGHAFLPVAGIVRKLDADGCASSLLLPFSRSVC